MSEKKQSSVDFLIEQIGIILKLNNVKLNPEYTIHTIVPIIEKLKAMHKEEIKEAWYNSLTKADYLSGDEYYNATFEK